MSNGNINDGLHNKYIKLLDYLESLESVAVAFSSGVDSTFLLYAAKEALGERAVAVTAKSGVFTNREYEEAIAFCKDNNIRHIVKEIDEFETEGFAENPKNRCYLCKRSFFTAIQQIAEEEKLKAVVEGSNIDDEGDYRPGLIAIKELGIKSPLRECAFTKAEIREMSALLKLPTSDKPSFACLASRIPYGEEITREKLKMIELSEQYLFDLGFKQFRVRAHGRLARIELLPEDMSIITERELGRNISNKLRQIGFNYVTIDLEGFRSGSLNEVLSEQDKTL